MKILVVDDEETILNAVQFSLERAGYQVITAGDSEPALALWNSENPDILLLDVMLPTRSGFELCEQIRLTSNVPIIMLTAKGTESDRVTGLTLGADDYITKPFGTRELLARIQSVMRRSGKQPVNALDILRAGELSVDPQRHEVIMAGRKLELTPREFELLKFLMENPGLVFDRHTLLDRVWGADSYVDERTVDVHIRWLREKIELDPSKPQYLLTVRGIGYKFRG
ncbi:MAG: response regulator [Armatimonadota bacterium]